MGSHGLGIYRIGRRRMTTLALEDMPNVFDMIAERNRRRNAEETARDYAASCNLERDQIEDCVFLARQLMRDRCSPAYALFEARKLADRMRAETFGGDAA